MTWNSKDQENEDTSDGKCHKLGQVQDDLFFSVVIKLVKIFYHEYL